MSSHATIAQASRPKIRRLDTPGAPLSSNKLFGPLDFSIQKSRLNRSTVRSTIRSSLAGSASKRRSACSSPRYRNARPKIWRIILFELRMGSALLRMGPPSTRAHPFFSGVDRLSQAQLQSDPITAAPTSLLCFGSTNSSPKSALAQDGSASQSAPSTSLRFRRILRADLRA